MSKFKEIHKACLNNNMNKFNKIIKNKDFKVNIRDNINFTPLMCASFSGNIKMVSKLLSFDNIQINAKSNNGKTALIIAATRGHIEVVKKLVNHGANLNIKQFKNSKKSCPEKTALNISLQCHHPKVSKYLKNKKSKKSKKYINWKV